MINYAAPVPYARSPDTDYNYLYTIDCAIVVAAAAAVSHTGVFGVAAVAAVPAPARARTGVFVASAVVEPAVAAELVPAVPAVSMLSF